MQTLPKPDFLKCNETSITLKYAISNLNSGETLLLQYKLPEEPWDASKYVELDMKSQNEVNVESCSISDLNPGTPYCVRFAIRNDKMEILSLGPETVFDTSPVDCGPKKKKCIIS